jgi:hypothetical protein
MVTVWRWPFRLHGGIDTTRALTREQIDALFRLDVPQPSRSQRLAEARRQVPADQLVSVWLQHA